MQVLIDILYQQWYSIANPWPGNEYSINSTKHLIIFHCFFDMESNSVICVWQNCPWAILGLSNQLGNRFKNNLLWSNQVAACTSYYQFNWDFQLFFWFRWISNLYCFNHNQYFNHLEAQIYIRKLHKVWKRSKYLRKWYSEIDFS